MKKGKLKLSNGQRIEMLVVEKELTKHVLPCGQKLRRFRLKCDCGNHIDSLLLHLTRGRIKNCGCVRKTRHGESKTKLYRCWKAMLERVGPKSIKKHIYYDRKIQICNEFMDYDFFKKWAIENGFKDGLQIDRKDNEDGYNPCNCRFVLPIVNANNKRDTFRIEYNSKIISLSLLLIEKGLKNHYSTIYRRIKRGWNPQKAVDTPIKKGNYFRKT